MKIRQDARFDLISLGEVMLRLDPGNGRVRTARRFDVWEGGGEYNVARGLRKCFGMNTAILTALADNEVGRLVEDLILQGGVNTDRIIWRAFDGVGRDVRNGLNFTERGYGVRGAVGVSDRGNTAVAQLTPGEFDWNEIFKVDGARWLHTGGIFAALSSTTADVAFEAATKAQESGTIVSYDLNYRPSLWKSIGGKARAQEVNQRLAKSVDVLIGNEEDFEVALGIEIEGSDGSYKELTLDSYRKMIEATSKKYPNLEVIAVTLRSVKSASRNDWTGVAWSKSEGFVSGKTYENLEIFDRVGGGDSFASGLIYGLLTGANLKESVELGLAHGALAMTTPGDTSMATLAEVKKLAEGGSARVQR
ncbi:MAG: 2-dehydro-3-deoxygluconokinase [Actinomycetota bacterium]